MAGCVGIACGIAFAQPPSDLTPAAMQLTGIFCAVIVGLLLSSYPISMIAGLGLSVLSLTQSLQCQAKTGESIDCRRCTKELCGRDASDASFTAALAGFADEVNWLVFCAFHIGKAVEVTRLGRRLSLHLFRFLGSSLLGLGYAVMMSEIVLGPFVPSNTARGGGIILPIVSSMAVTLGSTPELNARERGGEFLMLCGAHANLIAASLYPTGMAANPIVPAEAFKVYGIDFDYFTWVKGSVVPGLMVAAIVPFFLYHASFPSTSSSPLWRRILKRLSVRRSDDNYASIEPNFDEEEMVIDTPTSSEDPAIQFDSIRDQVRSELDQLGAVSFAEWKLIFILIVCLGLWLTRTWTNLDTTLVAFLTVMVMLYTSVITWDDIIHNYKCIDTFFWLGILIMMATQLSKLGVSKFIGEAVGDMISAAQISPLLSCIILGLIYFYSMYMFSSLTGHIVSFVHPFLSAGKHLNGPPLVVTAILAYFSTLCGCLTNFSSGPIVIYYSQGYCSSRVRWFKFGLIISLIYVVTYFTVGLLWWKILGWW